MPERNGLITSAQLAAILDQPNLRLFDCTTYLEYQPEGSDIPYVAVPGRHTFEASHIPGADFLDLQGEFSDQITKLRFMMPAIAQLEAAFGRHGIAANSRVVLYSIGTAMWATRFWWMLRSLGFENLSVLDGGLDKWKAEGRAVETGPAKGYPRPSLRNRSEDISPTKTTFLLQEPIATPSSSMRSRLSSTRVCNQAVTAGPDAFPAASTFLRLPCSIRRQRRLSHLRKQKRNSQRKESAKTSAWWPIAAAVSQPPSAYSSCTGSVITTSPFTT